jgi:ribosome biogenesis GTPase
MSEKQIAESGRVIASYGTQCRIESTAGEAINCQFRRSVGRPVCNDQVHWERTGDSGVITALQPRKNHFLRTDRRGRKQIVAANLDLIVIVVAPKPEPTRDLINRYLVACENVSVPAAICLNKHDLLERDTRENWQHVLERYQGLGYATLTCSSKQQGGLQGLRKQLSAGTSILVGQSGVGKSSIINRLLPDLDLRTQEISGATGKGRHTTTATTLYHLSGGGEIVDSPGVWEYGIWDMSAGEIAAGFRDFEPYLADCRFANCQHTVEPGCAVQQACEQGKIKPGRLESYRRIVATSETASGGRR